MTKASRVQNRDELFQQARIMISSFGGALIEEFISGREVAVLVSENPDDPKNPIVYPPVEFMFPPGEDFKHFDLKWKDYQGMTTRPLESSSEHQLVQMLKDATKVLFVRHNGVG